RSGTSATYEARVRPGLRAAQRRELARLPRSVNRAWARVQQHLAATTAGHLAVVTHGLVCRSLAARHVRVPGGETAPERWENTSVTIIDPPGPWCDAAAQLYRPPGRPRHPGAGRLWNGVKTIGEDGS